jgi:anthraniloyl-CoA monooxygenase
MRIACVGGGPAGLYFAILMKQAFPEVDLRVVERNRADDTFGFGVVFSDETLGNFEAADPESFEQIRASFASWTDIETWVGATSVRSTGHGFCGLARRRLLEIFQTRCQSLGVRLEFQREIADEIEIGRTDLVLACDGVNSFLRQKHAASFRPTIEWGKCRFAWFGTTRPLEAFTFVFRASEHGLFVVHAYPYQRGDEPLSTWIVECHEDTWRRAGLEAMDETRSARFFERLFADRLLGHPILTNRSTWRSFPTISCASWRHENVVLVGDAAHTAHFSIGSGTKLAMEDAIALVEAFRRVGLRDVPRALAAYEAARRDEVLRLQRAARTSREWFEAAGRHARQDPLQLTFNLMTRSKRITYDNLRLRDPELVRRVDAWFAAQEGAGPVSGGETNASTPSRAQGGTGDFEKSRASDTQPSSASEGEVDRSSAHEKGSASDRASAPMFTPLRLRGLELANRVVVSPMCQYSAVDGTVGEWHLVHLGSRAIGGAGLVMGEMTDVSSEGRITLACAGMYSDEHAAAWKRIVDFVHARSCAKIGLQLAHAGRKGSCTLPWEGDAPLQDARAWPTMGPSAVPFAAGWPKPRAMDRADMDRVREQFVAATRRALAADFDLVELHMAHGYLLSSFLSPLANLRTDEYGGALDQRMRYPLEVFDAVRAAWPADKPLAARISATDWLDDEGGLTIEDSLALARELKAHGCDLIDVSSAGNVPHSKPDYGRMYQVPFAERIRNEVGIRVMAVGAIQGADHVNTILAAGRADLCALARAHLSDPYLTLRAAVQYEHLEQDWPKQYLAVRPRPKKGRS